MRVFLTGAAGFIGSHLAERLCARGDEVVGFDNFDGFYPRSVKERNLAALRGSGSFRRVEGDLCRPEELARALDAAGSVDAVVHLAALAGVGPSLLEPERFCAVNVGGTTNLLEACRRRGLPRVVLASSSSVYGAGSLPPFREQDPCTQPISPYAATKRASELLAFTAHHLHGLSITCLRFFTVYGPRQRPDLAIHKFTRLIAWGEPVEIYGDGSTSRDYTYIDDIVDGVVAAVDQQARDAGPVYRTYNLGGSRTTSVAELVALIGRALGRTPIVQHQPEQPGHMRRTHADLTLAARELGYSPRVSIDAGIPRFVAWWRVEAGDAPA
jgi:UDP-glucuronate 4-epimerase